MGIGEQIAGLAQQKLNDLILAFGEQHVMTIQELCGKAELQELAKTAELDPVFLASQVACLGVGSAVASYPGPSHEFQVLVNQIHIAINRRFL